MTYEISEDRETLKFFANAEDRALLRLLVAENADDPDWIHRDDNMHEWFSGNTHSLLNNSELSWTSSDYTGDLTSAPMICILGDDMPLPDGLEKWDLLQGTHLAGHWDDTTWVQPILERWCFMDYMVRSVLQDLMEHDEAVFTGGKFYEV